MNIDKLNRIRKRLALQRKLVNKKYWRKQNESKITKKSA